MDPTQSFGSTQTQALTVPKTSSERRHDLDWLRVILFGLLIWFHLGVFTFWLFEDGDVPLTVFFVVDVMHQWRLAALFLISGMGTAFAFRRRDVKTFLNERVVRLGVPLLFATYVLLGGLIAPVETLWLMLVPFPGADAMPYAHLWFLRNLLLYSVLLAPLFAYVRTNPDAGPVRAARWTVQAGGGLALMTVPALILGASAILTKPWHYGEVGMWWEFPHYFLFTLFGYLAIQTGAMWFERIEALRWWLLATTLPLSLVWFSLKHDGPAGLMEGVGRCGEGPLLPLNGRSHAPANAPCVDVVSAGVRMGRAAVEPEKPRLGVAERSRVPDLHHALPHHLPLDGVRWNHRHELVDVNGPWYTLRGGWRAGVLRLVSADGLPAAFRRTAWGSGGSRETLAFHGR